MGGIEKPHTDKYKEIMKDWNYDASCMPTSLPVWDLENFKHLVFVVQSVQDIVSHLVLKTAHIKNARKLQN
jgi:hypothetical protein